MIEVIQDTLIDGIRLLPFLWITYLVMEYLEHRTENKTTKIVKNAGKLGPLFGGLLGIFPQCGFSAAAANLYAGRVVTIGTLIAVFLSTSDEMLPILISEKAPANLILKILCIKLILGIVFGFIIDLIYHIIKNKRIKNETEKNIKDKKAKKENENGEQSDIAKETIGHMCEDEHCDCEHEGIFISSIKHTINIFAFILVITFAINLIIFLIGEENVENFISNLPVLGVAFSCLIGLIPNCASSVIITELYLSNLISFGTMMAGLLVGSGVGILVLYKSNKKIKENISITILLYGIGLICGIVMNLILS